LKVSIAFFQEIEPTLLVVPACHDFVCGDTMEETMKVAFYQFEPVFGEKEQNVARVLQSLGEVDADLVVLPELFSSGYQFISQEEVVRLSERVPQGPTTDALAEFSRRKGIYLAAGVPEADGDRYYNSAILTGPEGYLGLYRKTHLFFEEKLWFSPGDTGFRVFSTGIGRIGIMICFDWIFPESMRTLALMGAEVIAHPANLVLPHCPAAMPVRCLENKVYAVTANRVGREERKSGQVLTFIGTSQVVGPDAKVYARAPETGDALMTVEVDLAKARDKSLNPFNDLFRDRRPGLYLCAGSGRAEGS
jgi:predicted amidohydrolase